MAKTELTSEAMDQRLLENAALQIYKDKVSRLGGSYSSDKLAEESFAEAKAFHDVAKRIFESGQIPKLENRERPTVWVHLWGPNDAGVMAPLFDETTGKPVLAEMKGDLDGYAPNLPADHPHNQRFYLARDKAGLSIPKQFQAALKESKQQLKELQKA